MTQATVEEPPCNDEGVICNMNPNEDPAYHLSDIVIIVGAWESTKQMMVSNVCETQMEKVVVAPMMKQARTWKRKADKSGRLQRKKRKEEEYPLDKVEWFNFVYLSTIKQEREFQWLFLQEDKEQWGEE
ncbi:elongation factor G [Striga asiatica]|uniref:Elongation factor G n=1 Tax=Striga asiatica TaxID=4170 RepID=A0A5A7R210_STRAF|nr:elongation factor G [Striga asiatica]